jgi:hypothetical protein
MVAGSSEGSILMVGKLLMTVSAGEAGLVPSSMEPRE